MKQLIQLVELVITPLDRPTEYLCSLMTNSHGNSEFNMVASNFHHLIAGDARPNLTFSIADDRRAWVHHFIGDLNL